jgi:hypothetical protein
VRSRLLRAVVIAVGFAIFVYAALVAMSAPTPAHAHRAIAVVQPSGSRGRQVVSVPGVGGAPLVGELRAAARRYEELGPVYVLVADRPLPRVYDANGRPHRRYWFGAGLGTLIILSTVCGQRCARVVLHRRAVKA